MQCTRHEQHTTIEHAECNSDFSPISNFESAHHNCRLSIASAACWQRRQRRLKPKSDEWMCQWNVNRANNRDSLSFSFRAFCRLRSINFFSILSDSHFSTSPIVYWITKYTATSQPPSIRAITFRFEFQSNHFHITQSQCEAIESSDLLLVSTLYL